MKMDLQPVGKGFEDRMNALVSRANTLEGYLNRVVFRQYQKAQLKRWQTENASEGTKWTELNPKYARQKVRRYASFPGAGKALMIATGKLVDAATGRDTSGLTKITSATGIRIAINLGEVPYAAYAAKERPFMKFGPTTLGEMRSGLKNFIRTGRASWPAVS